MSISGHPIGGPLVLTHPGAFANTKEFTQCETGFFVEIEGAGAPEVAKNIGAGYEHFPVQQISATRARVGVKNVPQGKFVAMNVEQNTSCKAWMSSTDVTRQQLQDICDLDINRYGFQGSVAGCYVYPGSWIVRSVECNEWGHPTALLLVEQQYGNDVTAIGASDAAESQTAELEKKIGALQAWIDDLEVSLKKADALLKEHKIGPYKKAAPKKPAAKKPAAKKPAARKTTPKKAKPQT